MCLIQMLSMHSFLKSYRSNNMPGSGHIPRPFLNFLSMWLTIIKCIKDNQNINTSLKFLMIYDRTSGWWLGGRMHHSTRHGLSRAPKPSPWSNLLEGREHGQWADLHPFYLGDLTQLQRASKCLRWSRRKESVSHSIGLFSGHWCVARSPEGGHGSRVWRTSSLPKPGHYLKMQVTNIYQKLMS